MEVEVDGRIMRKYAYILNKKHVRMGTLLNLLKI
jgi:hypothetical protein